MEGGRPCKIDWPWTLLVSHSLPALVTRALARLGTVDLG
jgi:hypothetical protein